MEETLCEKEFVRVGLSFWTGHPADIFDLAPFDCHTAASVGDLEYLSSLPVEQLDSSNKGGWTPLMYAEFNLMFRWHRNGMHCFTHFHKVLDLKW